MSSDVKLETPAAPAELYLAVTNEELAVFSNRPIFTGDVLRLESGNLVALIQHPCAMRRGAGLTEKLLVCRTASFANPPSDWSAGHFKKMFLPELDSMSLAINFEDLDVLNRDEVLAAERIAILAERGVNLLVQRWLHHNSRVIVPTITIHAQTAGPFEEADLVGEAIDELVELGLSPSQAHNDIDIWLSAPHADSGPSRRQMLTDPQSRGAIRGAIRRYTRERND